jgi:hypothetical protein
LITEAVLGVLAGLFISDLTKAFKGKCRTTTVQILLISLILIDLNPVGRRFINYEYDSYSEMRTSLENEANAIVAVIPLELDRNRFPVFVLDSALSAFPNDRSFEDEIIFNASQGRSKLFEYLRNRGVTHVLLQNGVEMGSKYVHKWGKYPSVDLDFSSPYFEKVALGGPNRSSILFKLNSSIFIEECAWCVMFEMVWSNVRETFHSQGYFQGQFYEDGDISWVLPSEKPTFRIVPKVTTNSAFRVSLTLHAAYGPRARPQIVHIRYGEKSITSVLGAGKSVEAVLDVFENQIVEMNTVLPCVVPSQIDPNNVDKREICFAISKISIQQSEPIGK